MEDNPEVVLEKIGNFKPWPLDECVSKRIIRRNSVVGTYNNGKSVYQTISASMTHILISR